MPCCNIKANSCCAIFCLLGASRRDLQETSDPGTVFMKCSAARFTSHNTPSGLVISRNSRNSSCYTDVPDTTRTEGIGPLAIIAFVFRPVCRYHTRRFLASISKSKCARKSMPIMGLSTSATTKFHTKLRRSPRFNSSVTNPNVLMEVPSAADNVYVEHSRFSRISFLGNTESSAPVPAKYLILDVWSIR